jgi:hypothetical protein
MASNKKRSEIYHFFKQFNLRLLVVLLLVFMALVVYGLRQNNLEMVRLKNQLMTADKNNGDVNGDLNKLRLFIYDHMNTTPSTNNGVYPPIQLKYTYQRLLAQARVEATATVNQDQTIKASVYCHDLGGGYTGAQLATCENWYVTTQPGAVTTIPPALYQFDFISPIWSPDLAGFSILISFGLLLTLISMFLFDKFSS